MHRHRNRQRATGHEVVHDGRDGIDANLAIKTAACRGLDRIGHEIFRAEAFLDVRDKMIVGLDEIGALAAHARGLAIAMRRQQRCRSPGGALAGALERIELVITHTGGFVAERHGSMTRDYRLPWWKPIFRLDFSSSADASSNG